MTEPPTPIIPFKAGWCLPNGFTSAEYGDGQPTPIPGDAGWERLAFQGFDGGGGGLFDYEGLTQVPVKVKASLLLDQPYLALRITLAGATRISFPGHGEDELSGGTTALYMLSSRDSAMVNAPDRISSVVCPILGLNRLQDMLGEERVPQQVRRFLDGRGEEVGVVLRTSPVLRRIVGEARSHPYQGAMASLHIQGKVWEMMAETMTLLAGGGETARRIDSKDRGRAMLARDIVMDELFACPTVEDLARRVGLAPRRLNKLFRELFGTTVVACVARWRLDAARAQILRGERSIKEVAFMVGYAHISSFNAAFARRFGEPPATYRRDFAEDAPVIGRP